MSDAKSVGWSGSQRDTILGRLPTVRGALAVDNPDEFRMADIDAPKGAAHATLMVLRNVGAVEAYDYEQKGAMTGRNIYRWLEEPREQVQEIVDGVETFPCGHRIHVYNDPDEPDGTFACKECGETYEREFVKEVL